MLNHDDSDEDTLASCLEQATEDASKIKVVNSTTNSSDHKQCSNLKKKKFKKKLKKNVFLLIILLLFTLLCIVTFFYLKDIFKRKNKVKDDKKVCYSVECIQAAAQMLQRMNPDIDPCQDFYTYSCGRYIGTNEVHPDYPHRSLVSEMEENLGVLLKRSMEREFEDERNTSAIYKAKQLYKSCLDQGTTDEILSMFKRLFSDKGVGRWPFLEGYKNGTTLDIEYVIANMLVYRVQPIFMVLTSRNEYDNGTTTLTVNIFEGLPELIEDVYFNDTSEHYARVRAAYKNLMKSSLMVLKPSEYQNIQNAIKHINAFERAHVLLLQYTYSQVSETNNTNISEMSLSTFISMFPKLKWNKILDYIEATLNLSTFPRNQVFIKVWNLSYLNGLMRLIDEAGPKVLIDYMMWRFLLKFMPYLTKNLYAIYKEFIEQVGMEQTNPIQIHLSSRRWKYCVDIVSHNLPIVMAASYTKTHFPYNDSSKQVQDMIPKFEEAFSERIKKAIWLSKESKRKLLEKVEKTLWKLASPEIVMKEEEVNKLHSKLSLNSSSLIINLLEIISYQTGEDILMTEDNYMRTSGSNPLVVNAFHATELNAIAIPMGVMSPPLLDRHRPSYLNFAGLGTLLGHEFMHGFNHMGITYDHEGTLNGSLTKEDIEKFKDLLTCFVEQYTEYVYAGKSIDGNHTLGENVCDSEGLELSLQAYKLYTKANGQDQILPGLHLSIDQLFFLQHAQIWCEVLSHKGYRLYTRDSHSPGKYRVIGAVRNSKSFSEAYNCHNNSRMNPKKKCSVWM